MKYCSHCGHEVVEEAVVCPSCGCQVGEVPEKKADDNKVFALIIKIFMILGCIATGWSLIPLLWTIPLTVHVCRRLDRKEPIGVGVKVCSLLFVNLIAGIMLLCMDMQQD